MENKPTWLAFLTAIVSSIGVGLCCVGPFVIMTFGLGTAWFSYVVDSEESI